MTLNRETKTLQWDIEVKEDASGAMLIEGYGAIFGNIDSDGDVVERGAFVESIRMCKPKMLWQHNYRGEVIGIWDAVSEDDKGLYLKGHLIPTTLGRDVYIQAKEKAIDGLSIGYTVKEFEREGVLRRIKQANLYEVSLVTFPANDLARITQVKGENIATVREFEGFLRDVGGFSTQQAKAIASKGWVAAQPNHRDDEAAALSELFKDINKTFMELKND